MIELQDKMTTIRQPVNGMKEREGMKVGEERLTKREYEVLMLIFEGKSSKEVADALYVSKRTVDFHLARIYEKMGVGNRFQAYKMFVDLGLLKP